MATTRLEAQAIVRMSKPPFKATMTNCEIPSEVVRAANAIDRGQHPRKVVDHADEDSEWTMLAACGQPVYLHRPSGYGVQYGAREMTAVIEPHQMEETVTLAMHYESVTNDPLPPFYGTASDESRGAIHQLVRNEANE